MDSVGIRITIVYNIMKKIVESIEIEWKAINVVYFKINTGK